MESNLSDQTVSTDLTPVEKFGDIAIAADVAEKIRENANAWQAETTSSVYGYRWRAFEQWCARLGKPSLPAGPELVIAYLTERQIAGNKRASLQNILAAIKAAHRAQGLAFASDHPHFQRFWKGLQNNTVSTEKQAAPLRPELIRDILATNRRGDVLDARNGAMLCLLYSAALRRSELAGLDYGELGEGTGVLRFIDSDKIEIELVKSKNHKRASLKKWIVRSHNETTFVAVERWIRILNPEPGSALMRGLTPKRTVGDRRINGDGIYRAVRATIKAYYIAIGDDPAAAQEKANKFGGHSGRVGFCTVAKERKAADSDIALVTGHSDLSMIARYSRQGDFEERAPHQIDGIGL